MLTVVILYKMVLCGPGSYCAILPDDC